MPDSEYQPTEFAGEMGPSGAMQRVADALVAFSRDQEQMQRDLQTVGRDTPADNATPEQTQALLEATGRITASIGQMTPEQRAQVAQLYNDYQGVVTTRVENGQIPSQDQQVGGQRLRALLTGSGVVPGASQNDPNVDQHSNSASTLRWNRISTSNLARMAQASSSFKSGAPVQPNMDTSIQNEPNVEQQSNGTSTSQWNRFSNVAHMVQMPPTIISGAHPHEANMNTSIQDQVRDVLYPEELRRASEKAGILPALRDAANRLFAPPAEQTETPQAPRTPSQPRPQGPSR